MSFQSASFLFVFLPAVFLLSRLIPGTKGKNALLAAASFVFYASYGFAMLPVLVLASLWDWGLGLLLRRHHSRALCALAVAGNLGLLCVYKYLPFAAGLFGLSLTLASPLGISFFTFHGISYVVDVYRDPSSAAKNPCRLFLYLAFFPRLAAGPIARYHETMDQLAERTTTPETTAAGLRRFVLGLTKKLLISEMIAPAAAGIYALPAEAAGMGLAWLGAVGYCLQLYFDFSGYSDMAIGLGQLFGFAFPENFHYPYTALTLSDFWRRWHMSLNRWFVDYLYIPLGGSRCGRARTAINKLIVFLCTGIWHGAGWPFLLWGLWHGAFVVTEGQCRERISRWQEVLTGRILLRVYTLLVVILGFVMFRASSLQEGFFWLGRMFCFRGAGSAGLLTAQTLLSPLRIGAMVLGLIFSCPVMPAVQRRFLPDGTLRAEVVCSICALAGFVLCCLALAGGGFSPFIYQQF